MTPKINPTRTQKWWQKLTSNNNRTKLGLTALGLTGLITSGCNTPAALVQQASAQEPVTATPLPTIPPLPTHTTQPPTVTPTTMPSPTSLPSPTPWPTLPPVPTATPWVQPVAWQPAPLAIPTLQPIPIAPTAAVMNVQGVVPVSYSPPDGVDVFGGTLLRWEYFGELAEDEWFDIKIKPAGSEESVFVDWSKEKEYPLGGWNGWQPGLYTWQIGIVKGYKEGDTKHFIADTGLDSQKSVIKWQSAGGGGGGGATGGGSAGGGGGGASGGS